MQVKRTKKEEERMRKILSKTFNAKTDQSIFYDEPEPYNSEKLERYMAEDDVVGVDVFKATKENMTFAELRYKYPNMTRRQIKKLMKRGF